MIALRHALTAYYSMGFVRDPVVRRHGAYALVLEYADGVCEEIKSLLETLEAEHCGGPALMLAPVLPCHRSE